MTKHTQGPWKTMDSCSLILGIPNGHFVADVVQIGKTGEADARLIAAAPELLTGLREALVWLSQLHIGDPARLEALQKWGTQQADLIAKIEGE